MPFSYPLFNHTDFAIHKLEYFTQHEQQFQHDRGYKMFWIKEGYGALHCAKNNYAIQPGCFYCVGRESTAFFPNSYVEGYALCLSPALFCNLQADPGFSSFLLPLLNFNGPLLLSINADDRQAAEDVLIKLHKECSSACVLKEEMLKSLLKLFLLYIGRKYVAESQVRKSREAVIMEAFTALLIKNISTQKRVADYAKALYVTPAYLNQAVKKASGYTASFHIQQQVITQAKQKAVSTGYSMKEIACDLGFEDMAHFSKFFKNNSGISFTGFRKRLCMSN